MAGNDPGKDLLGESDDYIIENNFSYGSENEIFESGTIEGLEENSLMGDYSIDYVDNKIGNVIGHENSLQRMQQKVHEYDVITGIIEGTGK